MATRADDGSWEIRGRRVRFPVRIADASVACAIYLVRTDRARGLVAGTGLDLVSVAGRTPLFLVLADYRVNDLGSYDKVGVGLLARHRGRAGPYIHQLAVTETFTLEASRALWGLPKWLAEADLAITGGRAVCRLSVNGRHALTAAIHTTTPRLPVTVSGALTALAPRDGVELHSRVRASFGGIRLGLGDGAVALGDGHRMADELRALGPPRRPLLTVIADRVAFDMELAVEVPR